MKVLIINSVCGIRSTGRIVSDLALQYINNGHECIVAYGREYVPDRFKNISYRITTDTNVKINALKARVFDNEAFNAIKETKKFIKWADNYNPDVLWLHNLHGYYINIELLFKWIKSRPKMKVKWTLHDCWAFTGHCAYFSYVKCDKWTDECCDCPQSKSYPSSLIFDASRSNFLRKKNCFTGVKNMSIITPSKWLAELVKQSFLKEYPVSVEYNTVDKSIFKPTDGDFRKKHKLDNKLIILGVASVWDDRKGLADFIELSEHLSSDYKIVLVGLSKKQTKTLPDNILCIEKTDSAQELAEIYSDADIFLNLSKEETFGLTTVEALFCGTYPIVYKNTACEEIVGEYGGLAVEQNINAVLEAIDSRINSKNRKVRA